MAKLSVGGRKSRAGVAGLLWRAISLKSLSHCDRLAKEITMLRVAACAVLLLVLSSLPSTAGPVTLVSKADPQRPSGTAGGTSRVAGISGDGRYVLLLSNADNLLPGVSDSNSGDDLFFHDRIAGTTVLVSHAAGDPSTAGDATAVSAVLSTDGRWAAFTSNATNLVAGQINSGPIGNTFLWDRDSGVNVLASHTAGLPTTAAGGCVTILEPGISADGSRVVFVSIATDLVAGQSDGPGNTSDVFLYDRATGTNTLVSHASGNATAAVGAPMQPVLSAEGNWVAFASNATNLVAGQIDANGGSDVFLYGHATGTSVLVSHAAGAAATAGNSSSPAISFPPSISVSADGSRVAYKSGATNLVAGQVDGNTQEDIFLYDRAAGTSTLVSHAAASATTAGDGFSDRPALSADGRYVAFVSGSSDLTAGAANPSEEIFVYDRIAGTNLQVSRRDAATPADFFSSEPRISADGAWIAFLSFATNLVAGQADTPVSMDVFLWSRASGAVTLATHMPVSAITAAGGDATELQISADAGWIALASTSEGLVTGVDDGNGLPDVFLYERATGANRLLNSRGGVVSMSAGGSVAAYLSGTVMSNDGRSLVFTSAAPNLPGVTADGNNRNDVFLYDRIAGTTALVSHAAGSPSTAGDAVSNDPLLSTDGGVVVFASDATNLVAGSGSFFRQLYLYERSTGGITLVSHAFASPSTPASGGLFESGHYAASGDGRWVAFSHSGSSLVAGQVEGNGGGDVFLFDRATGTNTLVSHASSSPAQTGNGASSSPSISADGRYVAFVSSASDLVPSQVGAGRVFLYDRITGTTTRVSSSGDARLALSGDGRWVAFVSSAADVVPGQVDTNGASDVFLWDRAAGTTRLGSHTPASPATAGDAQSSFGIYTSAPAALALSADGSWLTFYSQATDLVSGQTGSSSSVFLFDRTAGTVTLVSRSAASPTAARRGDEPAISADGRFVTFAGTGSDLVPGQVNQPSIINHFLYDRIAGTLSLVSHIPSSEVTSGRFGERGESLAPGRISADGAWVAFSSPESDLVAGDHDGTSDAFLYANILPGLDFFTVTPCRLLDTREAGQAPALASDVRRTVLAHGACGIPASARAIAVNVTALAPSAAGHLILHAGDIAPAPASSLNFSSGQTRSNSAIVHLAYDGAGTLAITPFVTGGGTVQVIVDVSGYFE
jgi:Tol biopolymer transport system component